MKRSALVLFSYKSHKFGYIEMLFDRLSQRAKTKGISLQRSALKELHITVVDNKLRVYDPIGEKDINEYALVYFELWYKRQQQALATALYAQRSAIPFFSSEITSIMPTTKVGEIAVLADANIPLPDTFTSSNAQLRKVFSSAATAPFSYPFILKADDGYGGNCNFLVKSRAQLRELTKEHKQVTFIAQEFIPNDCDYRCLIFGGKVMFVLKRSRQSADTHLNNTSAGAQGVAVPVESLPTQALLDVTKAAQRLGREQFAGVDLIFNSKTGEHYILEVNQTPQIEIGAEVEHKMDALLDYMNQIGSKR